MPTIRRLYLYAVALVSVEVVLWGAIGLARSFFAGAVIGGSVSRLAGALALILVGVPVFLIHWLLAQRLARRDPEERSARLRAVFLYGALLVLAHPRRPERPCPLRPPLPGRLRAASLPHDVRRRTVPQR